MKKLGYKRQFCDFIQAVRGWFKRRWLMVLENGLKEKPFADI
jgi:hypothetical protein